MTNKTKQSKSTLSVAVAVRVAMVPVVTNAIGKLARPRPGQPKRRSPEVIEES
jgi:hypothetical protein